VCWLMYEIDNSQCRLDCNFVIIELTRSVNFISGSILDTNNNYDVVLSKWLDGLLAGETTNGLTKVFEFSLGDISSDIVIIDNEKALKSDDFLFAS